MFKRDIILPVLSTLVISAAFLFISCAHKEKTEDDADLQATESEEQIAGSLDDSASAGADQGKKTSEDDLKELTQSADGGLADGGLNDAQSLGSNDQKDLNQQLDGAKDTSAKDEEALDKLTDNAKDADSAPPAAELPGENPPAAGNDVIAPTTGGSDDALAQSAAAPAPGNDLDAPTDETAAPAAAGNEDVHVPIPSDLAPKKTKRHHAASSYSGGASVPRIPGSAKEKGGVLLNRFYFARRGDTAKSVSQLIYGSPDKAKLLVQWNGGGWKAGKLIFYNSPSNPQDNKMLALYQENGVGSEEYIVQRGDWLSKIAAKKLGASGSWKEIAVVNGIDRPDTLEVGQKLAIFSGDLHGTGAPAQMADNKRPNTQQTGVIPPPGSLPPQLTPPSDVNDVTPPEPMFGKKAKGKGDFGTNDLGKMIEQNLFAVAVGGVLLLLLILLVAVNRKKKARRGDDFADDAFMAPKTKRK